jgi:cytochrome c
MNTDSRRAAFLGLTSVLLLAGAGAASASAFDDASAKAFFALHGCNACHAVTEFRIGPPFQAVALRYASEPEGRVQLLSAKIRYGGAGAWGIVPMVSNPKITTEEADDISRWILRQGAAPAADAAAPAANK